MRLWLLIFAVGLGSNALACAESVDDQHAHIAEGGVDAGMDARVAGGERDDASDESLADAGEDGSQTERDAAQHDAARHDAAQHDAAMQTDAELADAQIPDAALTGQFPQGGVCAELHAAAGGAAIEGSCVGALTFDALPAVPVEGDARGIAAGDLDGDGTQDLAVAIGADEHVAVLLNPGNGRLEEPVFHRAGAEPFDVAIADMNGDEHLDLITANFNTTVSVVLGNGDGAFGEPESYRAGSHPVAVSVADLDDDDDIDVAAVNLDTDDVSVFLNAGDGVLGEATNYAVGHVPGAVAIADFNGDLRLDLVVGNGTTEDVSVLLNIGRGEFAGADEYAAAFFTQDVLAADFTDDGRPDVVAAGNTSVAFLDSRGDGTFEPARPSVGGRGSINMTSADFNGDCHPDIAGANLGAQEYDVSLFENDGKGSFVASDHAPGTGSTAAVAVADFNGDGKPDIAYAMFIGDAVHVLLNECGL